MTILSSLTSMVAALSSLMSLSQGEGIPSDSSLPAWTGEPTILDVLAVKKILSELKPHPLPAELIDIIIDHAEYWPHTTSLPHPACRAHQGGNILVTRSMPLGYPDTSIPIKYPLKSEDYASGAQRFFPDQPFMANNYETTTPRILEEWKKASMPDTQLRNPCRKVVFNIRSHDQGWGGQHHHSGTYEGSFTWFDIGLQRLQGVDLAHVPKSVLGKEKKRAETDEDEEDYSSEDDGTTQEERFLQFHNRNATTGALEGWDGLRFYLAQIHPPFKPRSPNQTEDSYLREAGIDHPFLPHGMTLQKNLTATGTFKDHEIVLRWDDDVDPESEFATEVLEKERGTGKELFDGKLVRNLEVGEVITVWARARFPGWMNVVDKVEVKVYWAV